MTLREELSFLLTNRIPRRWLTLLMGWLSPIEQPLVSSAAIGLWKMFSDLDLSDAKKSRVHELAGLLHSRAEGGRAARSPRTPRRW